MDRNISKQLQILKEYYAKEGFVILGVFGSYARGEQTKESDLDILYEIKPEFMYAHKGFSAFSRLNDIKKELKHALGIEVDIAAKSGLSQTGKKYILRDLQYV